MLWQQQQGTMLPQKQQLGSKGARLCAGPHTKQLPGAGDTASPMRYYHDAVRLTAVFGRWHSVQLQGMCSAHSFCRAHRVQCRRIVLAARAKAHSVTVAGMSQRGPTESMLPGCMHLQLSNGILYYTGPVTLGGVPPPPPPWTPPLPPRHPTPHIPLPSGPS